MPLADIFFLGIVLYLLYKFVFNFFLPVFRTTKHVRQQFRNMQEHAQDPNGPFQRSYTQQSEPATKRPEPAKPKNTMGEYIDFEEIK